MEPSETGTLIDILNWDDDYIVDNLKNLGPIIKESFSDSTDLTISLRALKIVFGQCLGLFKLKDLDEEILKFACPRARSIFVKTLEGPESTQRNKDRTSDSICKHFSDSLCLCQDIVSHFVNAFVYIETLSKIKFNEVRNLLTSSLEILLASYEHCAGSEDFYGSYLNVMADVLTSFFRKAQGLQGHILKLLQRIEVEYEENEIDALNGILTFTYKCGITVMNLDVKTMADLWKTYICVIEKYSQHLKTLHKVSVPVQSLSVYIVNNLENFLAIENQNSQEFVKTSKILCFLLKIVIKFAENFSGYLSKCHEALIKLLTVLQKISHPYVEILKLTSNINTENLNQLIIGMDPLLSVLITDTAFAQDYYDTVREMESNERFAVLLLSNQIVRKLTSCDSKTRQIWFNKNMNIIVWMFDMINSCNYELCLDVRFPGVVVPGCERKMIGYFEYIFIHISAFLIKSVTKEYKFVEKMLAKCMLEKNPWCSLLAADIWCVLIRCCEAEMCRKHINSLSGILLKMSNSSLSPQKLYLEWITSRLFPLMTQKQVNVFLDSYPPKCYPYLWSVFGGEHLRADAQESVNMSLKESLACFSLSNEDFHQLDYAKMESVWICPYKNWMRGNKDLEEEVVRLWKFDPEYLASNILRDRYIKLVLASSCCVLSSMSSPNVNLILRQMKTIFPHLCTGSKILLLNSLTQLAKSIFQSQYETDICQLISLLFRKCLSAPNAFVRVRAVEVFSAFASLTRHTQIVTMSVSNDGTLQKLITNYIQKRHASVEDGERSPSLLKKLKCVSYVHACKIGKRLECGLEIDTQPPAKKVNLVKYDGDESGQDEVDRIVSRLIVESKEISRHADVLTPSQRKELSDVIQVLQRVVY